MAMSTRPSALMGGLLAALVLAAASAAAAAEGITGYRSAEFGMSSEAVMARLEDDGVVNVSTVETDEGDLIIDGELQVAEGPVTDLRYVFPAGSDQLALVVAFHPDVEDHVVVKEALVARHGQPWGDEMTEWWFEQLKQDMPQPPLSLTMWGGEGSELQERGRFVRLWAFEDYLSVEYLDTQRLR